VQEIKQPCPKCGNELTTVTSDHQGAIADYSYWWCLSCDFKSEQFYHPDTEPELGSWEAVKPEIQLSRSDFEALKVTLEGLADDLPSNQKVQRALTLFRQIDKSAIDDDPFGMPDPYLGGV